MQNKQNNKTKNKKKKYISKNYQQKIICATIINLNNSFDFKIYKGMIFIYLI